MAKSKKVRMPIGMRNKLMAAVSMLLVSSIMMVSTTFAWFTLSTAPEVTGITTSVGANGNLEMALLTTETFANVAAIGSAVGDSYQTAGKSVTAANITWGNLVDLKDPSYNLTDISLMPASMNYTTTGDEGNQTKTVDVAQFLKTPEYGADGRVTEVTANTVSAVYSGSNFSYDAGNQTYGVRAIGATSTLSARQIAFGSAKSAVINAPTAAKRGTITAINNNLGALLNYASATEAPSSYTAGDIAAFKAIANGVVSDIATLETAYKSAVIAKAASTAADDTEFAAAKVLIDAADLSNLGALATENSLSISGGITSLATAQTNAKSALTTLNAATESTDATTITAAIKLLVGESPTREGLNAYITTGAIGEIANQIGKFTLASIAGIGAAYAGAAGAPETGVFNADSTGVIALVNGLQAPSGTSTANITDFYGYVIDFAFRTNASGSNLQLQTSAVNRVYSDQTGADLATQGSGSKVTFTYTAGMTTAQAAKLLGAVNLAFLDPDNGTVHAEAKLTNITLDEAANKATADVKLIGQAADANVGTITALEQNAVKKVSVLVYMDGDQVDNSAVINAASSGSLDLNLQFSSSATLQPMQNTALKTMTTVPAEP